MEENETGEKKNIEEEYRKYVNKNLFPSGKLYALSSSGILRLFTVILCLVAFFLTELTPCPKTSTCYDNNYFSTYTYFGVISFILSISSLAIYISYIIGIVQNMSYRPRIKAVAEVIYMAVFIFFYFFAVVFLIPRTSGIIEYQLSAAIGSFALILITVNLALLLVRTNQSVRVDNSSSNSLNSEESEERWVPTSPESEFTDKETMPRLHSIRMRSSSMESIPMEEVDLTDNTVFADNHHSNSSVEDDKEYNLDKNSNDDISIGSLSIPSMNQLTFNTSTSSSTSSAHAND